MVYFAKISLKNSLMKLGEINISHNFSEIYMRGCIKRISHEVFNIHPLLMYERGVVDIKIFPLPIAIGTAVKQFAYVSPNLIWSGILGEI